MTFAEWKQKYGLNGFCLKVIAMVTMLIDHAAIVFLIPGETYINLRIIGRIAFPIFCFLLACIGKVREITSLIFDINGAIRVNYNIKQVLI